MNDRYGRNPQQGSRDRHGEDRNWDQGYDSPRQPQQWHDESIGQQGGWPQDDQARGRHFEGQGGYSSYAGNRHDRSFGDEDNTRGYGQSRSDYRHDKRFGADDYDTRRDYRSGAGYGARSRVNPYAARHANQYPSFTSNDYGGRDFSTNAPAPYGLYGGYTEADPTFYGGNPSGERSRNDYRSRSRDYRSSNDYGGWREYGESRGFLERAGDEIASWFGDEDAARRREQDHRGRGPANYTRSDERIREDANDALTRDWAVDASEVSVTVQNGEVTLDGKVHSRIAKRRAEDCVEDISGVKHVQNNLRVNTDWTSTTAIDASKATKTASGTTSTAR